MKFQKMVAKLIEMVSMSMAKKACGAASCHGIYQPREPKNLEKLIK